MKKIIMIGIVAFIFLFIGIIFFSGSIMGHTTSDKIRRGYFSENITSQTNSDPIKLGYCPTMANLAKGIASKNSHISLQGYGYTSEAFHALNNGNVEMVLVGRLAGKNELNNAFEKHLRQGLTLVGREKILIPISKLQNSRIHTAVDENLANEYFPNIENVIFHESTESAIKEGIGDLVLINWNDYTDNLGLVIPVDNLGNKIEKFRIPVLYSYDDANIKNLEV